MPKTCAWCGSDQPTKTIYVLATHKEETGFVAKKSRLHSLDLKLPICSSCDMKMNQGSKFETGIFIFVGIAGTATFFWLGNFLSESIVLCLLFGAIFSFGAGASLSNSLPKMFGFPDKKSWGRYDGHKLYFSNERFATEFYSHNPDLSPTGQIEYLV